jgi:hypothetical protein
MTYWKIDSSWKVDMKFTHNIQTPLGSDIGELLGVGSTAGDYPWQNVGSGTTRTLNVILDSRNFSELVQENRALLAEIRNLTRALSELISALKGKDEVAGGEVVILREIPRDQAKKEIVELFNKSGTLYFSDIAENLRLDLELVVQLCEELKKEGKIKIKE